MSRLPSTTENSKTQKPTTREALLKAAEDVPLIPSPGLPVPVATHPVGIFVRRDATAPDVIRAMCSFLRAERGLDVVDGDAVVAPVAEIRLMELWSPKRAA